MKTVDVLKDEMIATLNEIIEYQRVSINALERRIELMEKQS